MAPQRKRQRVSNGDSDALLTSRVDGESFTNTAATEEASGEKKAVQGQRNSLFVRSLAATTTTDALTEHFSQLYPLKHATIVLDPTTKQCKGYGFVTFVDAEDAQRAKEELNGSILDGRTIKVEVAEPRNRDQASTQLRTGEQRKDASKPGRGADGTKDAQQPPRLIVRNLPWSISKPEHLSTLFRSYGKVKHVVIPKNKAGVMAGFGIVLIRGRKNAEKALEGVNGRTVEGRTLAVDWAVDKDTWKQMSTSEQQPDSNGNDGDPDVVEPPAVSGPAGSSEDDIEDIGDGLSDDEDSLTGSDNLGSDEEDIDEGRSMETQKPQDYSGTLFVRNLPFTSSDESLEEHFEKFGNVRYARVVIDPSTERPRGTGFVCFAKASDAEACLSAAPKQQNVLGLAKGIKDQNAAITHSILQNVESDSTGRYTMEGRVLQLSRAVDRSEAARLTEEGVTMRNTRDKDKRRLYLLSEGTVASNSPLYQKLAPSEVSMREASAKQRKNLIEGNPSLHLSLTRLSIRNIPRSITSKDLKALAREAVVGFATDVKGGVRQRLSKEELERGGEDMKQAEQERKAKAKGIVKQAKIVFEGQEGGKVSEAGGAGRSRGYGFIEYHTHRNALMGLRWLNGHAVAGAPEKDAKKATKVLPQERKKRLIVEFAIENAQVVSRRKDREAKSHESIKVGDLRQPGEDQPKGPAHTSGKRKRAIQDDGRDSAEPSSKKTEKDDKLAKRQRIIAQKRMKRRAKKQV